MADKRAMRERLQEAMRPDDVEHILYEAMHPDDIDRILRNARHMAVKRGEPKKMEFSKCIMWFAAALCGGTWIVAAISWMLWREFPTELTQYTGWFFGAVVAYMVKSGYENRAKIICGKDEKV